MSQGGFVVGATEIAVIGGILGALTGAITFLFKALIESKDKTITMVLEDRDYWRDVATGITRSPSPSPQPQQRR